MAVEITLDLRFPGPGQQPSGQGQAEHLLAVEVAQEIDDEVADQDADQAGREREAAIILAFRDSTAARMIGASSGMGSPSPPRIRIRAIPTYPRCATICSANLGSCLLDHAWVSCRRPSPIKTRYHNAEPVESACPEPGHSHWTARRHH